MAKTMLIILTLVFMNGCGEKQTELTPKVEEVKSSNVNEEIDGSATVEFVPEHIVNSTIEVVPH